MRLIAFILSLGLSLSALSDTTHQQREHYLKARDALDKGQINQYEQSRQQLGNYPLLPYLDYQRLRKNLSSDPYNDVDDFLETHKGSYLGHLLLRDWLDRLASQQRWHEYRSYFDNSLQSATHQCLFLWSRFKTGDKQALEDVTPLWNVKKSQPDSCDALFEQWQQAGYMTVELVWSRYHKALLNRNGRLTRYLKRLMPQPVREYAVLFQKTLRNPSLIANFSQYDSGDPYVADILYEALLRHGRYKPDEALAWWNHYQNLYHFSHDQENQFFYTLARDYAYDAKQNEINLLYPRLKQDQQIRITDVLLRELLKNQDWASVIRWIEKLPASEQSESKWQYWLARAQQAQGYPTSSYQPLFQQLANSRNFYGFLAADLLNQPYNLEYAPVTVDPRIIDTLTNNVALQRAKELFYLDKMHDARQEWRYAVADLTEEEYQGAAQLAFEWGWYRKSIESMAAAESWDDLRIRFPMAHAQFIHQQAQQTNLPVTLIFAITRQESAWETDARSSAGAMGLMQLMPATAKETASRAGIRHQREYLLQPEHNITLGSRYIGELLKSYNNNRLPAIAAYNAGPRRVNQWLSETAQQLPHDVWIEAIPFNETRKYVQNVLSYSVVYAYQMGETLSMLTPEETKNLL